MWVYWVIGAVLVIVAVVAVRFDLHHRLDKKGRGGDLDPETAEALRQVSRDIDRGRGAGQGFF
jgi:hypothetical protein